MLKVTLIEAEQDFASALSVLDGVEAVVVTDAASEAEASSLFAKADGVLKLIEATRKEKIAPFREVVEGLNAKAKQLSAPFQKAKDALSKAMSDWRSSETIRLLDIERNNLTEMSRNSLEFEGDVDKARLFHGQAQEIAAVVPKTVKMETSRVQFRDDFELVITDPSLVPCAFCKHEPSVSKIKEALKSGVKEIAGVEWKAVKVPVNVRT
jgi:hypothetical protein